MSDMDSREMRKQAVRDAKTKLILDAALEVLSDKGYYDTRLEDIAEKAGFSKSALYRYYKDKDEIFFSIAIRERKKVIDKLTSDPECRLLPENGIRENLRRLLHSSFTAWGEHFSFILALNSAQIISIVTEMMQQRDLKQVAQDFLCSETQIPEILREIVDQAKERGEISTTLSSGQLVEFIQAILFSKVKKWHKQKKMEDVEKAVEDILTFFATGFGFTRE